MLYLSGHLKSLQSHAQVTASYTCICEPLLHPTCRRCIFIATFIVSTALRSVIFVIFMVASLKSHFISMQIVGFQYYNVSFINWASLFALSPSANSLLV